MVSSIHFDLFTLEPPSDEICQELKFFAKLIYVITGYCTIERETLIEVFVPVSRVSGYLSIICWLFAQIPQVIKNYERKSVEGISAGFLFCWFGGDFLNFASCIMTSAMPFQIMLSGYYCIIDVILASQWYFYSVYAKKHPSWKLKKNQRLKTVKTPNTLLRHRLRQLNHPEIEEIDADQDGILNIPVQHLPIPKNNNHIDSDEESQSPVGRSLYSKPHSMSFSKLVSSSFISGFAKVHGAPIDPSLTESAVDVLSLGKIMAWSCTTLYLASRIPQLLTNHKLKSTKGISILLFMALLSGNILYSVSLLTCQEALAGGDVTTDFWKRQLSYFLGASLTVLFDLIMLTQWYHWDYKHQKTRRTPGSRLTRSGRIASHHMPKVNENPISLSDTVEVTRAPMVILSQNHARKLSELMPLSPQDFLIDDYLGGKRSTSDKQGQPVQFARRVTEYGSI